MPAYSTLSVRIPAGSVLVDSVALPVASACPYRAIVAPFLKVTLPVGVLDAATVTVRVTLAPSCEGVGRRREGDGGRRRAHDLRAARRSPCRTERRGERGRDGVAASALVDVEEVAMRRR